MAGAGVKSKGVIRFPSVSFRIMETVIYEWVIIVTPCRSEYMPDNYRSSEVDFYKLFESLTLSYLLFLAVWTAFT